MGAHVLEQGAHALSEEVSGDDSEELKEEEQRVLTKSDTNGMDFLRASFISGILSIVV